MKILSTEVKHAVDGGWEIVCVILTLVMLVGIAVALVGLFEWEVELFVAGLAVIFVAVGFINLIDNHFGYEYEQHKVLITDYNEVHQNSYEIIDQEGEIFTIQKKGADEQ